MILNLHARSLIHTTQLFNQSNLVQKPVFKWNSSTPWSEMQLSPWNLEDDSTLSQMFSRGFAKLMWLSILGRVLGSCVKNYYLVGRQAVKRTTTYAGNRAAFSAELEADKVLKSNKETTHAAVKLRMTHFLWWPMENIYTTLYTPVLTK